ncbi:BnaA09g39060D [Brassica napus]|uniref:BnaA09g39060D protein n=1 Tax=Brassica napus TaxID=3708 RepID=A0A078IFZ3_BRANA|nr:BnaA09g39060D [Brassica napus]
MREDKDVAQATEDHHHQRQQNLATSLSSKLARTWITTKIYIFVLFIFLLCASLSWIFTFVLGESRFQVTSVFTRNTNKSATTTTNIPKIIIKIPLNCTLLNNNTTQTCPSNYPTKFEPAISSSETCPDYFRWIHRDLKVWQKTGITRDTLEKARPHAHFRVVIKSGRLYVHQYEKAFQTRDVFTIWGILQLLRMYPGQIPDLELLFLCHDKPAIWKRDFKKDTWPPPPLFHYCGHRDAYDIVFPDWSFWGWPELNIKEWNKLSVALKEGNKRVKWEDRIPYAYWKGNPNVSPVRGELMRCNFSDKYDPMVRLYVQLCNILIINMLNII